jgi:hypothetical protein
LAKNLSLTGTVTIASSGTVSTSITIEGGRTVLALRTPSTLTGTEFKFQASTDGDNFFALYNGSTEYAVTVAASRYIAVNTEVMAGVRFLKVVSGSSEGASRIISVVSGEL